jgi:hypothetical protein
LEYDDMNIPVATRDSVLLVDPKSGNVRPGYGTGSVNPSAVV